MSHHDDLLIDHLRQGHEDAYRYLYEHHYRTLCHIAAQYLRDDYMAETVVGDVIFHLWETRQQLAPDMSLRQYLVVAVRNKCLDYLKSAYASHMMPASALGDDQADSIIASVFSDSPADILLQKELEEQISAVIDSLPAETKRVFCLSRFEDKKYAEIATMLGISVNTVKYHIKRALAILADHLGEHLTVAFLLYLI